MKDALIIRLPNAMREGTETILDTVRKDKPGAFKMIAFVYTEETEPEFKQIELK